MKSFWLSPSALSILKDCPRCFWLDKIKKLKRPRGIFPSLPGGMDGVIKTYFDSHRLNNSFPPEIDGKLPGKLFSDLSLLEKWRSWRSTDLIYKDPSGHAVLSGALDDCLIEGDTYIPLDYKTRGSTLTSDPARYYQSQLDCYCLMLDSQGHKTNGVAYLLYYWPLEVSDHGMVKFEVTPYKIKTNIESAKALVTNAIAVLSSSMPDASPQCEYCNFLESRKSTPEGKPAKQPEQPKKTVAVKEVKKITPQKDDKGQFYMDF